MIRKGTLTIALIAILIVHLLQPTSIAASKSPKDYTLNITLRNEDGIEIKDAIVDLYGVELDELGTYPLLWRGVSDNKGVAKVHISNLAYDGENHQKQYSLKISAWGREPITYDFTVDVWDPLTKKAAITGPANIDFKMKKAKYNKDDFGTLSANMVSYTTQIRQVGTTEDLGWQRVRLAYMDNASGNGTTLRFAWKTQIDFGINVGLKFSKKSGQNTPNGPWEVGASVGYNYKDTSGQERKWEVHSADPSPIWAAVNGLVHSSFWEQLTYMPINDDLWGWVVTDSWQEVKVVSMSSWSAVWAPLTQQHSFQPWDGHSEIARRTVSTNVWDSTSSWRFGVDLTYKWAGCGLNVTTVKNSNNRFEVDNLAGIKDVRLLWSSDFRWPKVVAAP